MIDPYSFLQEIRTCEWDRIRRGWAGLALSLYYPDLGRPFDVRILLRWTPTPKAIAMGALAWKLSRCSTEAGYAPAGVEVLNDATKRWLVAIEEGASVQIANAEVGITVF